MTIAEILEKHPLPFDTTTLCRTIEDVEKQIDLYKSIISDFEKQYGCNLDSFEDKIEQGEVPEHPSWETSIEWDVAADELERLQVIRKALEWILNFSG